METCIQVCMLILVQLAVIQGYRIGFRIGGTRDVTVCEYRRKRISCGPNQQIQIRDAMYGRLSNNVCRRRSSRRSTTNCRALMSQAYVNKNCNGKRSCSLYASNSVFGNPCRGTFKYLRVKYLCVRQASTLRDVTVCENQKQTISCPPSEVIKINEANYGRLSRHVCKRRSARRTNLNCRARSSQVKVSTSCNNKRSCSLHASNSVFGDPCRGTEKYLRVTFQCVKQGPKACQRARMNAGRSQGAFVPRCRSDGLFEVKQCHSSTGYCWCVDPTSGNEIWGTKKRPGQRVTCGQRACARARSNVRMRPGVFVPRCKSDGAYAEKQCHGSTGYCWCVDSTTGTEIRGTRKGPGQGQVTCGQSVCEKARASATTAFGASAPKCKPDGTFEEKQCHSSTGYCWCVDSTSGKEIRGTRKGPGQGQVTCGPRLCEIARATARRKLGVPVPKCKPNGEFQEKQCHSSTGACWCVDPNFGNEIRGTRKGPGEGEVTCEPSKCKKAQTNAKNRGPGISVPRCKPDGTFEERQCHSSTGYCWCVDPKSGSEIRGTRKGPGQGPITCVTSKNCPMENGYCVLRNGRDQNRGVVKLDRIDGNTAKQQASCLKRCRAHAGATGCEVIWNRYNRGCYVHTSEIARGNGVRNHGCWVFSKCV